MKRKITKLEENLIEKGWELDHKTYIGKHSEKVFQYVYEKSFFDVLVNSEPISARVLLDSKRNHVIDVQVRINGGYVNGIFLYIWQDRLNNIYEEVKSCSPKNEENENDEEVVQVCEALQENE